MGIDWRSSNTYFGETVRVPERRPSGTTWGCVTGAHRYHRSGVRAYWCAGLLIPRVEHCVILGGQLADGTVIPRRPIPDGPPCVSGWNHPSFREYPCHPSVNPYG